ncbi:MAG TPA: hypothetical protein VFX38_03885 [Gammaproteobacteria bacterium]|nr:hypothetical protein [Gammaproteobacteria bacterium]
MSKDYVERQFVRKQDMQEQDKIVELICESPESVSAALQTGLALQAAKNNLLRTLKGQLTHILSEKEWKLHIWEMEGAKRYAAFTIQYAESHRYEFCMEFEAGGYSDLIYGICERGHHNPAQDLPNVKKALDRLPVVEGMSSEFWPWYTRIEEGEYKNWSDHAFSGIVKNITANWIIEKANDVYRALDEGDCLDELKGPSPVA